MKQCPQCKTIYSDETLQFCLQDGIPLVIRADSETESPTVAFSEQTQAFETNDLSRERYTTNKDARQVRVPVSPDDSWEKSQQTRLVTVRPEAGGSKTLIAVLATALVMLILFGLGIGAYIFFSDWNREVANRDENRESNRDSVLDTSPTPTATTKTPTEEKEPDKPTPASEPGEKTEPTETPPAEFDSEQVKKEIASRISAWRSLTEARNLNALMSNYAGRIDYYTKRDVDIGSVRIDKQKAFNKYDDIEINISRMSISTDSTGDRATAVFDKQWFFDGPTKSSEGKVQSQLKFAKIGGEWKIISEKDLKVYYVKR